MRAGVFGTKIMESTDVPMDVQEKAIDMMEELGELEGGQRFIPFLTLGRKLVGISERPNKNGEIESYLFQSSEESTPLIFAGTLRLTRKGFVSAGLNDKGKWIPFFMKPIDITGKLNETIYQ